MKKPEIVLNENLVASNRGKVLDKSYRAVLIRKPSDKYSPNGNGDVIAIQQPFTDHWGWTGGQWYAETLLVNPSDAISIDAGQGWQVDAGMLEALSRYEDVR